MLPARRRSPAAWGVVGLLVALVALGIGIWIYQLVRGLQITHMRDNVIWGLYIISFMFFVGLSAGGLIIASAGRLFGVDRFKPIVRLAVLEATVAIATAALLIIPDLGHPGRIYNLFIHPHWLSPMIWDITVVLIYLVLSLVYVWLYTRRDLAARGSWLALGTTGRSRRPAPPTSASPTGWPGWPCRPPCWCTPSRRGSSACRSRAGSGTRPSCRRCSSARRWSLASPW